MYNDIEEVKSGDYRFHPEKEVVVPLKGKEAKNASKIRITDIHYTTPVYYS